jgi:chorismate mutase
MSTALTDSTEVAVAGETADVAGNQRAGTPADKPDPTGASSEGGVRDISAMRREIDAIDAELVRLIQRRTELSRTIGAMRASEGGPRIVYSREMKVLERFADLGAAGTDLGMLLLSMGRGKLGRR